MGCDIKHLKGIIIMERASNHTKWILALCLVILIQLTFIPLNTAFAVNINSDTDWYGDGSVESYEISTAGELEYLATLVNTGEENFENKTITLTADIDFAGAEHMPIGIYAYPIRNAKPFKGEFDGGGYAIINMSISSPLAQLGLFGYVSGGTIKNLALVAIDISHSQASVTTSGIGGIIGVLGENGTISNSYVTGSIYGRQQTGGVVGYAENSTVENCYSNANVAGVSPVGGVIGYAYDSHVLNVYATGALSGTLNLGGIAGQTNANASVSNTVSLVRSLTTTATTISRVGYIGGGTVNTNYKGNQSYNGTKVYIETTNLADSVVGSASDKHGEAKTATEIMSADTWVYFDDEVWIIEAGKLPILRAFAENTNTSIAQDATYPAYITSDSGNEFKIPINGEWYYGKAPGTTEFEIGTADELAYLAKLVREATDIFTGKTITLTNDIDLSDYTKGEGWEPIGVTGNRFEGTFDGAGYVVRNLVINRNSRFQGLFGATRGNTIKNLGVIDVKINGGETEVGAIAGVGNNFENCFALGVVNASEVGVDSGGIVGAAYGYIKNCYSAVTGEIVGGIAGRVGIINPSAPFEYMYSTNKRPIGAVNGHDDDAPRIVKGVVALVMPSEDQPRFIYQDRFEKTYANNYVWVSSSAIPTDYAHDSIDGADVSSADIYNGDVWGENYANFPESDWSIDEGRLPILMPFANRLDGLTKGSDAYNAMIELLGVAIPAHILADLGIEPEVPDEPKEPDTANAALTGDASLIEGDDGEYTVSVTNAPNANVISLLVQIDGEYLTTKEITGLNGFSVLGDVKWDADAEAWRIVLTNYGNSAIGADEVEVCKIVLSTTDKIGVTIVKLTTATLTGATFEDGDFPINTIITSGEVEVNIAKYYSPYDTNRDGEIKQGDLSLAVLYYRATSASEYWSIAQYSDVNNDGIVNVEDFILIMANIVW